MGIKPRVAVVGAGYWGENLVRNFFELGHLEVICDVNQLLEATYRDKYPHIRFVSDYEAVLNDEEIDAVVISTPAITHYKMGRDALELDKHVFVEKPLALAVSEAEELVELSERNSRILMVGHILQYHNAILKLKELIDRGDLGKIRYIYSNRLSMGKIRTEENILWSFAPHDISVILMLLNETPEVIFCTGGSYLQAEIADVTMTTMNFSSGVQAHIFVSWLHPFKEQKLVVVGDQKMAVFDDMSEEKLLVYPHKVEWRRRVPVATKAKKEIVPLEIKEPLRAECEHFISCIQNGIRPRTDGREGLRVLKILKASQRSLDRRGTIVYLNKEHEKARPKSFEDGDANRIFVHESAYIDQGAKIGKGTQIWHFSHVLNGSKIGENCRVGQNVVIGPNAIVGNNCKIQNNVSIYEGVMLEDHVFCGPSMVFTNVYNPRSEIPRMSELKTTLVRRGATLGANCTIICGNNIGEYAFVAAGAVVTKDVPDYALVMGNPARIAGWMCKCGVRLDSTRDRMECRECGSIYKLLGGYLEKVG